MEDQNNFDTDIDVKMLFAKWQNDYLNENFKKNREEEIEEEKVELCLNADIYCVTFLSLIKYDKPFLHM